MMPPSEFPEVNKTNSPKNGSVKPENSNRKISDKAKALRESIANGTYQINSKVIAQRMMAGGVFKD